MSQLSGNQFYAMPNMRYSKARSEFDDHLTPLALALFSLVSHLPILWFTIRL